ncbi:hypothetical protein CAP35_15275 [Chitinophagaceae bacterium IBVUCB1]|nr:hypothetical protein CAP35_15275 [Chitinophagaceae bacterium IBVUCB1]
MKKHLYTACLLAWLHTIAFANPTAKTLASKPTNTTLYFVENKGQLLDENHNKRNDINFRLAADDIDIFIGNGFIQYQWKKTTASDKLDKQGIPIAASISYRAMRMRLLHINNNAELIAENKQVYTERYYLQHCPQGISAESYKKITYRNIYNNIDWVIYTTNNNKSIKYDFVVHPGGNPADIRFTYEGADNAMLKSGMLCASTEMGNITEQKPYSYVGETKQAVKVQFKKNAEGFGFETPAYDGTLVIDPVLNWGTYYGNPFKTLGTSVATDSLGNAVLCGYTEPSTAIASTATVHQPLYGGGLYDGYVLRMLEDGSRAWATYYGGLGNDQINAVACDRDGNVFVTGHSTSYFGLASTGSHQFYNGSFLLTGGYDFDAFIAKFNMNGVLQWGTFYGGNYYDEGYGIACDARGNVYVGGNTNSSNNISTTGAWLTTPAIGFLTKFNPSGTRLWGTYYPAAINTVTCDGDNNVLIAGYTSATAGIASTGAHLTSFAGGASDAFIAKFDTAGTRLWGTYYGGIGYEEAFTISTDSFRNVYLGGITLSQTGIATTGAFQSTYSGPNPPAAQDAFIAKFNKAGVRQWGTYLGDSLGADRVTHIFFGPDGALYCSGRTGSYNKIATPGNFKTFNSGPLPSPVPVPVQYFESDGFLMRFDQQGKRKWGTYFGGGGVEYAAAGAYTKGKIYLGGTTNSTTDIGTLNGFIPTMSGPVELRGYLAQFQADTNVFINFPYTDTMLCAGDTLHVKYNTTNKFATGNTFTVQLSNISGSFASPVNIGSVSAAQGGAIACYLPLSTVNGIGYRIRIISSAPRDTFYNYDVPIRISQYRKPQAYAIEPVCENTNITLGDAVFPSIGNFTWTGPAGFSAIFPNTVVTTATLAKAGDYILECDNFGCKAKDTVNVRVVQSPAKTFISGDTSVCTGDTLLLTAACVTPGIFYQWIDPKLTVPQNDTFFAAPVDTSYRGRYRVTAITTLANCPGEEDTVIVHIRPLPRPVITDVPALCTGDSLKLNVTDTATVTSYQWIGPTGFSSNAKSPVISKVQLSNAGNYTVTNTNVFGCTEDTTIAITIKQSPDSVFASNNSPVCSKSNLQLTATNNLPGTTYTWAGPAGFNSTQQNPLLSNTPTQAAGLYTVTATLNGCTKQGITNVTVNQSPDTPVLTANTPLYVGEILRLQITNPQTGVSYLWSGPNNYLSDFVSPVLTGTVLNMAGIYSVTASIADCKATSSIKIDIQEKPEQTGKTVYTYPNPNKGKFTLIAGTDDDMEVPIYIFGSDGKLVHTESAKPVNKKLEHVINLGNKLASGVYRIKVQISGKMHTTSVSIQ